MLRDMEPRRAGHAASEACGPSGGGYDSAVLDCLVIGDGPDTAVLVHGSGGSREDTWSHQLELAARHRLVLPDRRGYGASSPGARPDFEADGADIADLLGAGAHLVGFSYGGIGSLLAAARRPHAVRSLAVIEPPAFGVAAADPAVAELVRRLEPVFTAAPATDPLAFDAAFDRALGFDHVAAPVGPEQLARLDAYRRERAPWEARLPLAELGGAAFPRAVFRGDWSPAFSRVAETIAGAIGARLVTIPGGHGVQHRPGFNAALEELWAQA